jgi:two-component system LytT family response regulator
MIVQPISKPLNRIIVRSVGRSIFVNIEDIDWIEADRSYVVLHAGTDTHLIRDSLRQMEAKLDPAKFVRIHRSAIVNLDRVKELQPLVNGDQIVLLADGTRLTLSRSYREQVLRNF